MARTSRRIAIVVAVIGTGPSRGAAPARRRGRNAGASVSRFAAAIQRRAPPRASKRGRDCCMVALSDGPPRTGTRHGGKLSHSHRRPRRGRRAGADREAGRHPPYRDPRRPVGQGAHVHQRQRLRHAGRLGRDQQPQPPRDRRRLRLLRNRGPPARRPRPPDRAGSRQQRPPSARSFSKTRTSISTASRSRCSRFSTAAP